MLKRNKIYFIHYHFIKGGVNTVIKKQIEVLKRDYEIFLIYSLKMSEIRSEKLDGVNFINLDELHYQYFDRLNENDFVKTRDKILKFFYNKIDKEKGILWVHNYHLGKNVSFTDALIRYINDSKIPAILQIHDFPECSRWENYKFLKKFVKMPLYPSGENIYYVLVNKDDFHRVKNIYNNNNVYYLPNPVEIRNFLSLNSKKKVKRKIESVKNIKSEENKGINQKRKDNKIKEKFYMELYGIAKSEGFNFNPHLPIILYPVRTIRRKNILEAILFARIYKEKFNLFVTLPANSLKEREYENIIEKSFKNKNFNGIWGISKKFPQYYETIINYSALFLSTSVLEGFGLMFIEAFAQNKLFFARKINVLKDFPFVKNENVYENLYVPFDEVAKKRYYNLYFNKINSLPVEKEEKEKLMDKFFNLLSNDYLDFSFFTYYDQYKIVQDVGFINEIKKINQYELKKFENLLNRSEINIVENNYFMDNKLNDNYNYNDKYFNYYQSSNNYNNIYNDIIENFSISNYRNNVLYILQNICINKKLDSFETSQDNKNKNNKNNRNNKNIKIDKNSDNNKNNKSVNIKETDIEKMILKSFLEPCYLRLLFD